MAGHNKAAKNFTLISFLIKIITCFDIIPNIFSLQAHLHANCLFYFDVYMLLQVG